MEIISDKEEIFLNKLFSSITEDIVCFDIGANKGFYSKSLLNNRRDKISKLYCFEPVKSNVDQCIEFFGDDEKVEIHQKGCYNEQKISKFFRVVSPSDLGAEGLSSLNRREVFNNYPHEEIEVELIVIEDYLDIPNEKQIFAKIDVEGFELEVLMGMKKFFTSGQINSIQFEYGDCMKERGQNLSDIIRYINQFEKYRVCDFDESTNDFIMINEENIENYINKSWSNLYIIKI
jgi:FkbM family methyltransferase